MDIARGGREGDRTAKARVGRERTRRSPAALPALLRSPRGPPPCHLITMHLLEVLSLGCCLAAGALLLGPRQPAAAAAYESGQGYYEEEPDAGEPKVRPCPAKDAKLARRGAGLRDPSGAPLASPTGEEKRSGRRGGREGVF